MSVPRSVTQVMWAISQDRPSMPKAQKRAWAKAIIEEATLHNFDPFTMIAIMHNESRLVATAVDKAGKCIGLGQYCLTNIRACRVSLQAEVCQQKKAWLLVWRNAMSQIGSDITTWRKYCRKKTGRSALFARWLAGYQGAYAGRKDVVCGMRKVRGKWIDLPRRAVTSRVMGYRRTLIKKMTRSKIR